jgi:hypothetical protein
MLNTNPPGATDGGGSPGAEPLWLLSVVEEEEEEGPPKVIVGVLEEEDGWPEKEKEVDGGGGAGPLALPKSGVPVLCCPLPPPKMDTGWASMRDMDDWPLLRLFDPLFMGAGGPPKTLVELDPNMLPVDETPWLLMIPLLVSMPPLLFPKSPG